MPAGDAAALICSRKGVSDENAMVGNLVRSDPGILRRPRHSAPGPAAAKPRFSFEVRSVDGSANNLAHPTWGQAGTSYQRLAPAHYADGVGAMVHGPNPRSHLKPGVQLARGRPVLRAQRQPVGAGCGDSSSTTPSAWPGTAPKTPRFRSTPPTRSRAIPMTSRDPVHARCRRAGYRYGPSNPRQQSTRSTPTSTPGRSMAAPRGVLTGCATGPDHGSRMPARS